MTQEQRRIALVPCALRPGLVEVLIHPVQRAIPERDQPFLATLALAREHHVALQVEVADLAFP